jgi:hypothetical protein
MPLAVRALPRGLELPAMLLSPFCRACKRPRSDGGGGGVAIRAGADPETLLVSWSARFGGAATTDPESIVVRSVACSTSGAYGSRLVTTGVAGMDPAIYQHEEVGKQSRGLEIATARYCRIVDALGRYRVEGGRPLVDDRQRLGTRELGPFSACRVPIKFSTASLDDCPSRCGVTLSHALLRVTKDAGQFQQ